MLRQSNVVWYEVPKPPCEEPAVELAPFWARTLIWIAAIGGSWLLLFLLFAGLKLLWLAI